MGHRVVVAWVSVVAAGCQLITGSYSVGGDAGAADAGTSCLTLASCCGTLPAAGGAKLGCDAIVSSVDEAACQTELIDLRLLGRCNGGALVLPDSGTSTTLAGEWLVETNSCADAGGALEAYTFDPSSDTLVVTEALDGCSRTVVYERVTYTSDTITIPGQTLTPICGAGCAPGTCSGSVSEPRVTVGWSIGGGVLSLESGCVTTLAGG